MHSAKQFVDSIKREFHPAIYDTEIEITGAQLGLIQRRGSARYALAIFDYNPSKEFDIQLKQARSAIRKSAKALWMLRELGVFIIFLLPNEQVLDAAPSCDRTGLHAVTIQGVHLISAGGEHRFSHASWSITVFGAADAISERLQQLI